MCDYFGHGRRGKGARTRTKLLHLHQPVGGLTVKTVDVVITLGNEFNKGQDSFAGLGQ